MKFNLPKTLGLTMIIGILGFTGYSQKKTEITKPEMPISNDTKIVSYTSVIELAGISKDELFLRAQNFYKSNYKNSSQVIQSADAATGKIEGKAQFTTEKILKNGVKAQADMIKYSINLMLKDGKYKYEITNINIQAASYKPIETYFSETDPLRDEHWGTLNQADEYFNNLVGLIKEAMEKPSSVTKSEDW
ncbi:MAG: DUF4468 domain-containing protein [Bacteroidota bacterium]